MRQKATVQGVLHITILAADGLIDGDQVSSRRKGALDLKLGEGGGDGGKDVPATEHLFAN